ncbi:MAG: TatD family hydrolase [Aeromonas sp.]
MQWFDSHCHLDAALFAGRLDDLLPQWQAQGVTAFMLPAVGRCNWAQVSALAARHPSCYFALGIHPWQAAQHGAAEFDLLRARLAARPAKLVAIGECGLDLRSDVLLTAPKAAQEAAFAAQIALAKELYLPLSIHSVRANDTVAGLLRRAAVPKGGVIHAFSGSLSQAKAFWQLGFRLGVGGILTYPRAQKTQAALAAMPLAALVLETDAPDMALCGEAAGQNTPASIIHIAHTLAALRPEPWPELAAALYQNTCNLFAIS